MSERPTLNGLIQFLEELANKLDYWAAESRAGGWSTHQVERNMRTANDCRRLAAQLRAEIRAGASATAILAGDN